MKYKRIFLIVLDSVGIGEASDAFAFADEGCNTFKNTIEGSNIDLPNLKNMGMYNLIYHTNFPTNSYYGRLEEVSNGKDTLTGHLEMMGINTVIPFKTFTENGFPMELINELEELSGRSIIGNCDASGTEIIKELGEEHINTGKIIVYTSADSVLQIAAHEDVVPLLELYKICEIARKLTLKEEWKVGRIIARPFTGTIGNFERTPNRHDYALDPVSNTVLDNLKNNNYDVISIGKIADVFNNCGVTKSIKTIDNMDGISKIIDTIKLDFTGLCFANLNDFDSKYGHRRDKVGYMNALKEFDDRLPEIISDLNSNDLLIITADHGNDPTYKGTDHTRENTPLLIYNNSGNGDLGKFKNFASIGATIADNFNVELPDSGTSILDKIK